MFHAQIDQEGVAKEKDFNRPRIEPISHILDDIVNLAIIFFLFSSALFSFTPLYVWLSAFKEFLLFNKI